MPWQSRAQQRWGHSSASDLSSSQVKEFDRATEKKKGGFAKLPEKKMAEGGEVGQDMGALDRWMAKRARMACGGMAGGGDVHIHYHHGGESGYGEDQKRGMGKTYYEGGAIEPVWSPLDEQDEELLEEEPEEERHRTELLKAFAGALARRNR